MRVLELLIFWRMPRYQARAIPYLKTVKKAASLSQHDPRSRNGLLVREAGELHDRFNAPVSQKITPHVSSFSAPLSPVAKFLTT